MATRTDTLFPSPTLFRSDHRAGAQPRPVADRDGILGRPLLTDRGAGVGVDVVLVGDVAPRARHDVVADDEGPVGDQVSSEENTSDLQSLMRISYAVFCVKHKNNSKWNRYEHKVEDD